MLASEQPVRETRGARASERRNRTTRAADQPRYRVAAVPVFTDCVSDIILHDQQGQPYLLASDVDAPTPIEPSEINSLAMFFEPSLDSTWHTAGELHTMFYGSMLSEA